MIYEETQKLFSILAVSRDHCFRELSSWHLVSADTNQLLSPPQRFADYVDRPWGRMDKVVDLLTPICSRKFYALSEFERQGCGNGKRRETGVK
jgi:hypothetical protein